MSAPEPIIPRNLVPICERLYRALKAKPCACTYQYEKGVITRTKLCSGCNAMQDYEAVREVLTCT